MVIFFISSWNSGNQSGRFNVAANMGWLSEGVAGGGFEVVLVVAGLAVVMAASSLGRVIIFFVIILVLVAGGLTVVAVGVSLGLVVDFFVVVLVGLLILAAGVIVVVGSFGLMLDFFEIEVMLVVGGLTVLVVAGSLGFVVVFFMVVVAGSFAVVMAAGSFAVVVAAGSIGRVIVFFDGLLSSSLAGRFFKVFTGILVFTDSSGSLKSKLSSACKLMAGTFS